MAIPSAPILTTTPMMSSLLTKIVSAQVITSLRQGRGWLPPEGVMYDTYATGHQDVYAHASYEDIPVDQAGLASHVLVEAVTPTAEAFASDEREFQTTNYGRVVTYSSEQLRTNPHGFAGVVSDKVTNAALETIDAAAGVVWGGYAAAGVKVFAPGATPAVANAIDTPSIVKAVVTLESLGVQPLSDGAYGCLARPEVIATLQTEAGLMGWTEAAKYADASRLQTGEVGMYRGVRFFALPRILAKTASVYPSFFFGRECLAWADLSSLAVSHIAPSPSITDPLGQRGAAGFSVRCGGQLISDVASDSTTRRFRVVVLESTPTVLSA